MTLAARTYVALVHYPVYDRDRQLITTAITNLDIHDLARSSMTYGISGYHLITPIAAQRELASRILRHWTPGQGPASNDFRRQALERVEVLPSIEDSIARITQIAGAPLVCATSARSSGRAISYGGLPKDPALSGRPLLLLFGTGWGLAEEVVDRVDRVLAPIQGGAEYNHLSVRSAAAIVLDRLFGDRN